MANTKTATKRARQALTRQGQNQIVRSSTRTCVRSALDAIKGKDPVQAKAAYILAVKALSKAASKGATQKDEQPVRSAVLLCSLKKHYLPH